MGVSRLELKTIRLFSHHFVCESSSSNSWFVVLHLVNLHKVLSLRVFGRLRFVYLLLHNLELGFRLRFGTLLSRKY